MLLGFPILLFWVAFVPLFGLFLLMKNIKKEDDNKIKQYFLILYQGLKPEVYYWEFVNSLRKVLILLTLTVLISYNPFYKILVSVLILIISVRVQLRLEPYSDDKNNEIELLAIYTGSLTLFSGIIFSDDKNDIGWVNLLLFIAVLVANITFIVKWVHLFFECMSEKYKIFAKLLEIMHMFACKKSKYIIINLLNLLFYLEIKEIKLHDQNQTKESKKKPHNKNKGKKKKPKKLKKDRKIRKRLIVKVQINFLL